MNKTMLRVGLLILMFATTAGVATATTYNLSISVGSGTLSYSATVTQEECESGAYAFEIYYVINYTNFSYKLSGATYTIPGTAGAVLETYQDYGGTPCSADSVLPIILPTPVAWIQFTPAPTSSGQTSCSQGCADATAELLSSTVIYPLYKVAEVLYSPPGNQSSEGYGTSTTHGTTDTIGSSFNFSYSITFSSGVPDVLSGSASIGWSKTTSNSTAFTETWTDATSVVTDDNSSATYNPTGSNAINHNLDSFVLWLNPVITVYSNGDTAEGYTANSQPTTGLSTTVADILPAIPAITMEPLPGSISTQNPSGISSVPVSYLVPQAIASSDGGSTSYMPGLGAICKNNSLYVQQLANPSETICTLANQCGCAPSDFVKILQQDPLLNYNGTTYTASPYPGTESPLELDSSGASTCGENPIPTTAKCRYAIVPIEAGSTTTQFESLSGTQSLSYSQTDSTSTTETLGEMDSTSVGIGFSVGPLLANLKVQDTWTWTDSESWGTTNGESASMMLTFKTSTAACLEDVNIFEDTVYHTYVFQIPAGNHGC